MMLGLCVWMGGLFDLVGGVMGLNNEYVFEGILICIGLGLMVVLLGWLVM